ncbi:MAG: alanine-tRNA synthetase second additional domain-containing protein [Saccharofermentanales bacterium]|jgi:hypothetical protein
MSYSDRMQRNHLYSVLLSPRGAPRMADQGTQIAQQFLSPFDLLIGLIGDSGSGKSIMLKGMFPGLELTNDDEGVNVRPLPIMHQDDTGFFTPHTYHLDIRFELAFYQAHELADAIRLAVSRGKRVVIEHFDLIYPYLGMNAHLLIGVGEEIIVTRPSVFGPEPNDIKDVVFASINNRRMAHTAEDLVEYCLIDRRVYHFDHYDVRSGFILSFHERPEFDLVELERDVKDMIARDLPISYLDNTHILIGDQRHYCTGPRMHVKSTGEIKDFQLYHEFLSHPITNDAQLLGLINMPDTFKLSELNSLQMMTFSAHEQVRE